MKGVEEEGKFVDILTHRLVYDLGTQNLNFVAPIPEQVGTTTMHFSDVRRHILKFARMKVGRTRPN